jgi:phenol 2-monooxygenase
VRKSLGLALEGDSANQAWGVMDVPAITDFPDFRLKSAVQSANEGNLLIIPREGGYLVRLYIELEKLNENERASDLNVTPDHLIAAAQRILHPFTLAVKEVAWWSVYEIGQRLCDKYDDMPDEHSQHRIPRVFIAGDACHTHSPKAGQGMNVSMQDAFNLGWKLASVLRGRSSSEILRTYSNERQAVAKELIDFDRKWARMFSAPPKDPLGAQREGVDPAEFQRYFAKLARFTAGTETGYPRSVITGEPTYQHLAEGFTIGMRFHSAPVIRVADAKPVHLGHVVEADGRWRVFAFADAPSPAASSSRLRALCEFLVGSPHSPVRRHTPAVADIDSVIDVRAILQQGLANWRSKQCRLSFCRKRAVSGSETLRRCSAPTRRTVPTFSMRGVSIGLRGAWSSFGQTNMLPMFARSTRLPHSARSSMGSCWWDERGRPCPA